jgi:hypothetical protein
MAEFRPSAYLIGIVIFTFFIVGGISLMSILKESNPTYATDEKFSQFNQTFNVYQETTSKVSDLSATIGSNSSSADLGTLGALGGFTVIVWQALKLMMTNWSFMNAVFLGLTTIFGIPGWIPALIILAITIMFVFAVFSAFFYRGL